MLWGNKLHLVFARSYSQVCGGEICSDRRNSVHRVFPIPEISGNKLILLYPGAPCKCPRCGLVTLSTNCNAMHSMARHLEIKHSLRLEKAWRCSKCGTIEDGKKIRSHDVKCSQSISQPPTSHTSRIPTLLSTTFLSSQSEANISEHLSPRQTTPPPSHQEEGQEAEAAPNESWLFSLPRHDAEDASRVEDFESQIVTDALLPASSASILSEPSSPEQPLPNVLTLSTTAEENPTEESTTPDMSTRSTSDEEDVLVPPSENPAQRPGHFFHLWGNLFRGCNNMEDLNDVLGRCTTDWLTRASTTEKPLQEQRPRPENPPERPRRRNQSRQLQRIRQRKRSNHEEASCIQKLFNIYPRRAVRQVPHIAQFSRRMSE